MALNIIYIINEVIQNATQEPKLEENTVEGIA